MAMPIKTIQFAGLNGTVPSKSLSKGTYTAVIRPINPSRTLPTKNVFEKGLYSQIFFLKLLHENTYNKESAPSDIKSMVWICSAV